MRFMILIAAAVVCAALMVTAHGDDAEIGKCRQFLESYGWEVSDKPTDEEKVFLPLQEDEVYKSYNTIQSRAGLDISPYYGRSGVRYTFEVKNYPADVGEPVYANVVCIDGAPVAGDIMTVSIHGFMHSLLYPSF